MLSSAIHTVVPSSEIPALVADRITAALSLAIAQRGRALFLVAGGSSFSGAYALLGQSHWRQRLDWTKVELFFGDERCVPADHADSNFRMLQESLLAAFPENAGPRVHRIQAELSHQEAIASYVQELDRFADGQNGIVFDLVLLGLGSDGHTASLFPSVMPMLLATPLPVAVCEWPGLPPLVPRITLTPQSLALSRGTVFLATGTGKARIVADLLADREEKYPASHIWAECGPLELILDEEAASLANM